MAEPSVLNVGGEKFDYDEWRYLVAHQQMTTTSGGGGGLFVGSTGSGKSTAISVLLGAQYEMCRRDRKPKLAYSPTGTPQTSSACISKTLHMSVWKGDGDGGTWIDSAGFGENRGKDKARWTMINLYVFLHTVGSLDAIVVALDFKQLDVDRGASMIRFAEQIAPLFSMRNRDNGWLFKSLVFHVINASFEGEELSVDEVKEEYRKRVEDFKTQLKDYQENLMKTHNVKDAPELFKKLNEGAQIQQRELLVRLVEHIGSKESQVVVFNIRNAAACKGTKQRIEAAVAAVPTLQKDQLTQLGTGQLGASSSAGLHFAQVLGELCQRELPLIKKKQTHMDQLRQALESDEKLLEAIESDHKAVKKTLLEQTEGAKQMLLDDIKRDRHKIDTLETSTEMVELCRKTFYRSRPTYRTWYTLGIGTTQEDYVGGVFLYSEGSFHSYEVRGSSVDTSHIFEKHCDSGCGSLVLSLRSRSDMDLDAVIVFKQQKKDHPSTVNEVHSLKARVKNLTDDLQRLERKEVCLKAAGSAEALKKIVIEDLSSIQKKLEQVDADFNKKLPATAGHKDSAVTVAQYMTQLAHLLELLKGASLLPKNLDKGIIDPVPKIDDFLTVFNIIEAITRKGTVIERFAPSTIAPQQDKAAFNETQEAVLRTHEKAINTAKTVLTKGGMTVWECAQTFTDKNAGAVAAVAMLTSLLVEYWAWWRVVMFSVACVAVLAALWRAWVAAVDGVRQDAQGCMREAVAELAASRGEAREALMEVADRFAAKLNVDVRADLDPTHGAFAQVFGKASLF